AQNGDPLEQITAQVDSLISADTPDGRFITAAIALLEPEHNRVSLYSAGHGPIFFYQAGDDRVQTLDSDQPPLGIGMCESAPSQARILPLSPGDALVLVTDGFFEWANPTGQSLGTEGLGELIRSHQEQGAEQWIGRLRRDVVDFVQGT